MKAIKKFKLEFQASPIMNESAQVDIICPMQTQLILALQEVFPKWPKPVTTHFHYVKELWRIAASMKLKNKKQFS